MTLLIIELISIVKKRLFTLCLTLIHALETIKKSFILVIPMMVCPTIEPVDSGMGQLGFNCNQSILFQFLTGERHGFVVNVV